MAVGDNRIGTERTSAGDDTSFLGVPLAASLFGTKKLEISPNQQIIKADIQFLQDIGPTAASGLKDGIRPRVEAFFKKVARRISEGSASLEELRPVLEFLARGHSPAWMLLSEIEEEAGGPSGVDRAADYVRRYLETQPPVTDARPAWKRLVTLYRAAGNLIGACDAILKVAEIAEPPLFELSSIANWLNTAPEAKDGIDVADRRELFGPIARLMESRISDASATDLSRLAWLHLHSGDAVRARQVAKLGLERDPNNTFCQRLVERFMEDERERRC
ncbi:MAG: hypothetical protein IID49_06155 [Proteobacteria bacterium]|nr:hypothetical protein [Pseudomonadota bacterium]